MDGKHEKYPYIDAWKETMSEISLEQMSNYYFESTNIIYLLKAGVVQ